MNEELWVSMKTMRFGFFGVGLNCWEALKVPFVEWENGNPCLEKMTVLPLLWFRYNGLIATTLGFENRWPNSSKIFPAHILLLEISSEITLCPLSKVNRFDKNWNVRLKIDKSSKSYEIFHWKWIWWKLNLKKWESNMN